MQTNVLQTNVFSQDSRSRATTPNIRTDSAREVKHFRCGVRPLAVLAACLLLFFATACGDSKPKENVQPPRPGVPSQRSDVQGIYRTVHQALLQLRGNGTFVLIIPEGPGPSAGDYTLERGRLTLTTDDCGATVGEYDVMVGGVPEPNKATLHFTVVNDGCSLRARYLTIDPWVYAVS